MEENDSLVFLLDRDRYLKDFVELIETETGNKSFVWCGINAHRSANVNTPPPNIHTFTLARYPLADIHIPPDYIRYFTIFPIGL